MSNITKTMLLSLMLASALAAPANATSNLARRVPARFAESERMPVRPASASTLRSTKMVPARPDPLFTIIDNPDAGTQPGQGTRVWCINASGTVSGQFRDSTSLMHAYLRTADGTFSPPISIGGYFTEGGCLNDKGDTSGEYIDDNGLSHAWILYAGDSLPTTYDAPNATTGTDVQVINDKGVQEGDYYDDNGAAHGYLRSRNGNFTEFDDPAAGTGAGQGTYAYGLNQKGIVAGTVVDGSSVLHGYIRYADGSFSATIDISGAGGGAWQGTQIFWIDNNGVYGGNYIDANDVLHGFYVVQDGTIVVDAPDAGTGPGEGTEVNGARTGLATGDYSDASGVSHGFTRNARGKIIEFDAPGAGTEAGLGTTPFSINSSKAIAGWFLDENGVRHGFIRKP